MVLFFCPGEFLEPPPQQWQMGEWETLPDTGTVPAPLSTGSTHAGKSRRILQLPAAVGAVELLDSLLLQTKEWRIRLPHSRGGSDPVNTTRSVGPTEGAVAGI